MTILFLCSSEELVKEPLGYVRAFRRRGINVAFAEGRSGTTDEIRDLVGRCEEKPTAILHPETGLLPWGLHRVEVPTACFQVDTYAYTAKRISWSMLFDYPLLFHPGFDERFRRAGHPRPVTLPHAVEAGIFRDAARKRSFEVGWVGRFDGPFYAVRRRLVESLAGRFRMNEWSHSYSYEEMAEVYKNSRVVVNVSRDDYPQDANLRVFEAMAAGALLVTHVKTELGDFGFCERRHFVGYQSEEEVPDLVRYYLDHEEERSRIADAARDLVLHEHTYDRRVDRLLDLIAKDGGRLFAPARKWPEEKIRLIYLDYFAAYKKLDCAWKEWGYLARECPWKALGSFPLLAWTFAQRLRP